MHAVLGVDLEAFPVGILNDLVNPRGAVALCGLVVQGQIRRQWNRRVEQCQVAGLVFLVVGIRQEHRGQPVKADFVVGFRVVDFFTLGRRLHRCVIRSAIVQGKGQLTAENILVYPDHRRAQQNAELVHETGKIAGGVEFLMQPRCLHFAGIGGEVGRGSLTLCQCFNDRFSRQHAALHRGVVTLDLHAVEGAGVAADEQAAREIHTRQRIQAALGNSPGPVDDSGAAFQVLDGLGVMLPALELLERAHMRIAVVQVGNQADVYLVVLGVVHKCAAAGPGLLQGPPQAVNDQALLVLLGWYLPDFLDADAVMLGVLARVQRELVDQLLAQVAPAAFGEQCVPGVQLHAGHVAVLVLTIGADTHVTGGDSLDPPVVVVQHFRGGETGVNFHTEPFGLLRQPTAHIAHGDNVVTLVVGRFGDEKIGQLDRALAVQVEKEPVSLNRSIEWRTQFLPVGKQLVQCAGFQHGPRQGVGAYL